MNVYDKILNIYPKPVKTTSNAKTLGNYNGMPSKRLGHYNSQPKKTLGCYN